MILVLAQGMARSGSLFEPIRLSEIALEIAGFIPECLAVDSLHMSSEIMFSWTAVGAQSTSEAARRGMFSRYEMCGTILGCRETGSTQRAIASNPVARVSMIS